MDTDTRRKASGILFALALLAFLLPWATITCNGIPMMEFRGTDMVFGKDVENTQIGKLGKGLENFSKELGGDPPSVREKAGPYLFAILAGFTGLTGIFFVLFKGSAIARVAFGILGAALLIALQIQFSLYLRREDLEGLVAIRYEQGYWLALLFFAGAAAVNFLPLEQWLPASKTLPKEEDSED